MASRDLFLLLPSAAELCLRWYQRDPRMEWTTFTGLRREFGLSRSTSGRLIAAELITARRLGRKVLIYVPSVREFLNRLPAPDIALDARAVRLHKKFGVDRTHIASTGDAQTQEAPTAA